MSYILLDETIPLFLKLDKDLGGISFNSSEIGFLLSSSGFFMIFFTSLILPELASMRKSKLFMISILFAIPAVLAWPSIAVFNYRVISHWSSHNKETLWALLITCASIKNVFACMTFTAVMMQVNDSCPSRYLGAVNGLGQSLGALARAIGPALGGILWSLSQKNHFIFTNFIVCAFLLSLCQLLNCFLPEKVTQNSDFNEEIVFNEMI
jgi:cyanate permease